MGPTEKARVNHAPGLAVLKITKGMVTVTTTTTTAAVHTMAVIAAPKQSPVARLKRNTARNVNALIRKATEAPGTLYFWDLIPRSIYGILIFRWIFLLFVAYSI